MRVWRRSLAALMIVGFVSAQFISLAQACMNGFDPLHGPGVAVTGSEYVMPADCPAMAQGGDVTHSACEAHCVPREQADRASDVRIALAPPSFLVVRLAESVLRKAVRATPPRATIASPPLSLLFSRFLH